MIKNRKILILLLIVAIGATGCGLFSSKAGDAEIVFAPTDVGTPEGDNVTKTIGPAGGMLTSPDGRMTLTVPQGAVSEPVVFSMQPITNKAGNGLGLAYRLEPDGKTFTTPVEISVRYTEQDLEGTVPEALSLAYQDTEGGWHLQEEAMLDQNAKILTIMTTHFTDWSFLAKMRLEPAKATLGVGETQYIVLIGCKHEDPTLGERFRKFVFGDKWNDGTPMVREYCQFGSVAKIPFGWYVDIGTIETGTNPVLYTAPRKKPTPNVATVVFPYSVLKWDHGWQEPDGKRGVFTSHITIVDRGYRATGKTADLSYSGTICDLEKPFTVNGSVINYRFDFTPSSATGGKVNITAGGMMVTAEGGGSYTIEGADTDKPRIAVNATVVGHSPAGSKTGSGTVYIDLVPLDTRECYEK